MKKNYFDLLKFSFLLIAISLASCSNGKNEDRKTYFGGKIKNPREQFVYFLKDEKVLDSAKIENSRFLFELNSIENGLYTFKHGPEFQYLYLEPQDSLLLYLNTWNFDETINFSGKGSRKNNFLINLFLKQEEIEKLNQDNFHLDQYAFAAKVDSITASLVTEYEKLIEAENEEPSEFFQKLAEVAIFYPGYSKMEYFPMKHKDQNERYDHPEVSDDFYTYRSKVDLNDEDLISYATYRYYIKTFLYNQAFEKEMKDSTQNNFSLNFMAAANEHIKSEKIRNILLASGFWISVSAFNMDPQHTKEVEDFFFAHCTDEKYIAEAKQVIDQRRMLKNGDSLPFLRTYNINKEHQDIKKLIRNRDAVIYFWPKEESSQELLVESLHDMHKKYPEIIFIGIEREKSYDEWAHFIKTRKLPAELQYKIDKNCTSYPLFKGDMARTLILDKGLIMNNYLLFTDSYTLEKNLALLKK
ncbi:hypothetical protein [Namhaeicola litoreus]|uniref:Thioredoxin domain-containing protein n=1 Tax=Namhaeicola litoreus TaxID=1052145 RepID=A0ABW3Y211_9FLAO